jgi:hypothetical protein
MISRTAKYRQVFESESPVGHYIHWTNEENKPVTKGIDIISLEDVLHVLQRFPSLGHLEVASGWIFHNFFLATKIKSNEVGVVLSIDGVISTNVAVHQTI